MQSSLRRSGPVMATDEVTLGAGRPGGSNETRQEQFLIDTLCQRPLCIRPPASAHINLNFVHDGIDLVCVCDAYELGCMYGRG